MIKLDCFCSSSALLLPFSCLLFAAAHAFSPLCGFHGVLSLHFLYLPAALFFCVCMKFFGAWESSVLVTFFAV